MSYALDFYAGMVKGCAIPQDTYVVSKGDSQLLVEEVKDIIEEGVYDDVSPNFWYEWEDEVDSGSTIVLALCRNGKPINHVVIRLAAEDEIDLDVDD